MNLLKLAKIFTVLLFLALMPLSAVFALTAKNKYVRSADYFLKAGSDISEADFPKLAKFDLIILPQEAQVYNKKLFTYLREQNPDIIILAYTPTRSINLKHLNDFAGLRRELLAGADSSWYLYDQQGKVVSTWPETKSFNITTPWNEYLPRFVHAKILSTGLWDGIFYDEVDADISYKNSGNIDLNRDGVKDNSSLADSEWRRGTINLLRNTRNLIGSDKIIMINGSSYGSYQPYVNGRMFESFPTPWEGRGTWEDVVKSYKRLPAEVGYEPIFVINGNTNNTGNKSDYRKFRYGLTSTLLGNGYFGFDFGDENHGQVWYYDEYNAFLGLPTGEAKNIDDPKDSRIREGIWRRDFRQGVVIVNATDATRELRFKEEFEKIRGQQDPAVNNGAIVSRVKIGPRDGLILLRPIEQIKGAVFTNASFARIFDRNGLVQRSGFFAYDSRFRGSARILVKDINFDGKKEFLVADKNKVTIYNSAGKKITEFYPYGQNYDKGVNIDVGDLNNDGTLEIVTGTKDGGGPQIRIFNAQGKLINPGFFAYGKSFRGGVNVAVGDLNGDGWNEIIAGAGVGGGPHIRVFNKDGKLINPGFFAYGKSFRGGVNVAVGDLNGDGLDEIVAGPGFGGGPQIRIFDKDGKILSKGFFAYNKNTRGGIKVAVSDLNGDGKGEILAFTTDVFTLSSLFNKL